MCNNSCEAQNWFNVESIQPTQLSDVHTDSRIMNTEQALPFSFFFFTFSSPNLSSKWSFSAVFLDSSTLWTPALGLSGGLQIEPAHPVRSFWTQWMILLKISSSVAVNSLGQFLTEKSRSNPIEKKKNPRLFINSFWAEHSLTVKVKSCLGMCFMAVLLQQSNVQIRFLSLDEKITQTGAKTFEVKRSGLTLKTNMKSTVLSLNPSLIRT